MPAGQHFAQRLRFITGWIEYAFLAALDSSRVVGQFHHVIEIALRFAPADVQDIHEVLVRTGDGFKGLDPGELAVVGTGPFEAGAVNYFYRPILAGDAASQPDLSVSTPSDPSQERILRDGQNTIRHSLIRYRIPHESKSAKET
jgi:hypothetical protein